LRNSIDRTRYLNISERTRGYTLIAGEDAIFWSLIIQLST
jgi:hypothetical protein